METSIILGWARATSWLNRPQPIVLPASAACRVEPPHQSLGQFFIDAREQLGLTREQVAREARILVSYLEMIECDDYSATPDVLYLLPFFQRYAMFLGLNVRDVTSRFMRDFEAEENAVALSVPSALFGKIFLPWRRIAQAALVVAFTVLIVEVAGLVRRQVPQSRGNASPAAIGRPSAPRVRSETASTPTQTTLLTAAKTPRLAPKSAARGAQKSVSGRHVLHSTSARHRRRRGHAPR